MTGTGARLLPLTGEDPQGLGPYRLLVRLAAGGMGRVYLARSTADGGLVAVKSLLAEGVVSEVDRRRFAREVTLARRINSAHTARVRAADPEAERPWMAIDYIPAPSLAELVRVAGVLPAQAASWVAAGVAAALFTLHREGIVHRDVKPQNILLPGSGARVIDFGISHAVDVTRTGLTLGTISFTSPEQARGESSTAASDVYSFGATLFHLAVGRPPYPEGEDTLQLLARVARGEIDTTGLPAALDDVVHRCLSLEPARRPGPDELLAEFATELAAPSASQSGRHWLPASWARLMGAYERQGAELAATLGKEVKGAPPRPDRAPAEPRQPASPTPSPTSSPNARPAEARSAAARPADARPAGAVPARAQPAPVRSAAAPSRAHAAASTNAAPPADTRPVPGAAASPPRRARAATRTPRPTPPAVRSDAVLPEAAKGRARVDHARDEQIDRAVPPDPTGPTGPTGPADPAGPPDQGDQASGPVTPRRPVVLHRYPAPPPAPIRRYPVAPTANGEHGSRARWLFACGVALVLIVIGVVLALSGDGEGDGDDRRPAASSSDRPIDRARHTDAGDCLAESYQSVEVVSCASERASWRVTFARTEEYDGASTTSCPTGPGRQSSEYIDATRLRTLLCLRSL
ncbi:protein kinase [Streptomyces sp. NPDC005963]|uniref:protein kinase domain-containing protein n=1 Tax=Streptomyces sp. NPDC005963 TaxID=3156721 RepID=UPI0033DFEC59